MFGKLTLDAIPYHEPIIMGTLAVVLALGAALLGAITWYTVLACFKLGIVLEGTHARAFAGKAPKEIGDFLHAITMELFEKANRLVE